MNAEKDFAGKITAHLDRGTADLRAGTVYRLQQARARALSRLDPAFASAYEPALATAGARLRTGRSGRGISPVRWLGVALIVAAAAFGWQQWRAFQQVQDLQDIDAQILSSDLPLDAYLDRGFLNWLKTDSEH
jgi:hypothetical protein